jgi:hypothetical protein
MVMLTHRRDHAAERRPQKITFGEMRGAGVRGILIYCSDYRCSHSTAISGDQARSRPAVRSGATIRLPSLRQERG